MPPRGPDPGEAAEQRDAALALLGRAQQRAVALDQLAHGLAATDSTPDVVRLLGAALCRLLDCDAAAVWLWDADVGEIRAAATDGLTPDLHALLLSVAVRPDETPELSQLLARREPLVLNRGAVTPVLEQLLEGLGLQAAIGVPLLSGGRLLGAVTACWVDGPLQGSRLDEAVQRLQGVGDQGANALLKADLLDRARFDALHDALTGLPNRLLFHRLLDEALRDGPARVGLLFCDLDRFKQVNDELGHAAGDEVLRRISERLSAAVPATATVARLSGDEFAVLLPDVDAGTATAVGKSLVTALEEPLRIEGHPLRMTLSVGVALHSGELGRADRLLRSADAAMYDAKRRGRNQVVLARSPDRAPGGPAPSLAAELRDAVDSGGLRLFLQPVFQLGNDHARRFGGAEALVRWQHPRLGLLAPGTFLAVAEEHGSVVDLDLWVLDEACREAAAWPASTVAAPSVAVNLSLQTLLDDRLHEAVRATLVHHGLPPDHLMIEVVESRALRDLPVLVERLTALRYLGVRVALDDFGTGFSTLSWLQQLPVDTIKVDRSLTVDLSHDQDHRRRRVATALLRGVVAVGAELGVRVVAEGVETPQQLDAVHLAGCRHVQGYLLARPGPPEQVLALLG